MAVVASTHVDGSNPQHKNGNLTVASSLKKKEKKRERERESVCVCV